MMNLSLIYSRQVRKAAYWSEKAHRGVNRKSGDVPYFIHPVMCATLGAAIGCNDDELCALLLHDTVEDTTTTLNQLVDEFGVAVASLVAGLTKNDALRGAEQKKAIIEHVRTAEISLVMLKGIDVACNSTDIIFDVREFGFEKLAKMFNDPQLTIDHYLELMQVVLNRLEEAQVYPLLVTILKERFQEMQQIASDYPIVI